MSNTESSKPSKRGPSVFVIFGLFFLCATILAFAAKVAFPTAFLPETPAQKQQRENAVLADIEAKTADAKAKAQQQKRTKDLCHWADVCSTYGKARQDCAVAGDFQNCIDVKMGQETWRIPQCADDGTLLQPPVDMPGAIECAGVRLESALGQ
ncbi:hypothetical protein MesoLj131c_61700 [Mesorhizobium sp. 131-3-5]|uniref:hypothetical protein n=1 Tax=Mesorhizobium sp. 131-3-5 TaxID=2744520 RepID=UPI0019256FCB|nr:hypothetical protein [Mesorhizobium sp. 131-3-5]BCH11912.1 hypothetical protein MesoLj131c_61700 [Mesorhizobium sp. 131-3-5]